MTAILLVCMGNICRSPMAEAVLRIQSQRAGVEGRLEIDSAGTHACHEGEKPDPRAMKAAMKRGYDLSGLRARRVKEQDFTRFDLILAMDRQNLTCLRRSCPEEHLFKLGLFLQYARGHHSDEVPDPYYGSKEGFEKVLDLCELAGQGLLGSLNGTKL